MAQSASVGAASGETSGQTVAGWPSWLEIKDRHGKVVGRVALNAPKMVVGRLAPSAIHLDHSTISRQHAEFFRDPFNRWWVRDLGSRNGVKINHLKVAEGLIGAGDVVRLGDFHFVLQHAPKTETMIEPVEACPPLTDMPNVDLSTVDEAGSPQIDARHLMAAMELGGQLRQIADAGQRRREMCDFMLGDQFRGQAALVLHVDRATPNRPQVLCSMRAESSKGRPLHISTTLLRNVMDRGRALMASNAKGRGADLELSIAPEFMQISAAACPLNIN